MGRARSTWLGGGGGRGAMWDGLALLGWVGAGEGVQRGMGLLDLVGAGPGVQTAEFQIAVMELS